MWVDPGSVAVQTSWTYCKGGNQEVLYPTAGHLIQPQQQQQPRHFGVSGSQKQQFPLVNQSLSPSSAPFSPQPSLSKHHFLPGSSPLVSSQSNSYPMEKMSLWSVYNSSSNGGNAQAQDGFGVTASA